MGYLEELLMDLVMQTVCPRCEAGPNVHCRTVAGVKSEVIHHSRIEPLREAFRRGQSEGGTAHLPSEPTGEDIHA